TLQVGIDLPMRLSGYWEGIFLGAGMGYQYGLVGGSSDRAYISSMRPEERDQNDRWETEVQYLSAYQAVGYRYFMSNYASVAIRFSIEELLQQRHRTASEDVLSYSAEASPPKRRQVTQSLSLFAGLHF